MKFSRIIALMLVVFSTSLFAQGKTATDTLKVAVDELIAASANEALDRTQRKKEFERIISDGFDFPVMAQRIVAQYWRTADKEQKARFIELFKQTMVNTYFDLFEQYTNEKVSFLDEKIKKERYATVNTEVLSKGKLIPVTYKLVLRNDEWRAYDFVVEGISLIRSYNDNYKAILKRDGLGALNDEIERKLNEVEQAG